jgi:hypothetical protein
MEDEIDERLIITWLFPWRAEFERRGGGLGFVPGGGGAFGERGRRLLRNASNRGLEFAMKVPEL